METLADVADALKELRRNAGLSQEKFARSAGVPRVTLARMETAAQGDMSVAKLLRLLGAAGFELTFARRAAHARTLNHILAEQRGAGSIEHTAAGSNESSTAPGTRRSTPTSSQGRRRPPSGRKAP